jgi:signal transduction histidine kinase
MTTKLEKAQILYEIAMSVGNSLDMKEMLRGSLSMFLRKLNCSAGGIHVYNESSENFSQVFSIPRRTKTISGYNEALKNIPYDLSQEEWNVLQKKFPIRNKTDENVNYYILEIPGVGFLILIQNTGEIDQFIIKSLGPILLKIANSYKACLQNEELEKTQEILEKRVEIRTKGIKNAYYKLKQTQTQLLHSEKMASIGQLAAGIAHEINNPIGFILSNIGTLTDYVENLEKIITKYLQLGILVKDSNKDIKEIKTLLEEIENILEEIDYKFIIEDVYTLLSESITGTKRVNDIVQNLKSFANLDEAEIKDADINECLETTLGIVWNELKYKAEVVKNYSEIPIISCYPGQLNQVFLNIVLNAVQAIEEKGIITIKTEHEDSYITISISDNGMGIPRENLSRLFDPFFTTKPVGKGTGLGLSISYGIIEKHNGNIEVESEVGKGTKFIIKLPFEQSFGSKI